MKFLGLLISFVAACVFSGCAANTTVNPKLAQPINPQKAEIVGSKLVGEGGIPHQIYLRALNGKRLRNSAVDQTLKIWEVEPGVHEFLISYTGSTGKIFINPFTAEGLIKTELQAGRRYIAKIESFDKGHIIFYLEDALSLQRVAASDPVALSEVPILVPIPR